MMNRIYNMQLWIRKVLFLPYRHLISLEFIHSSLLLPNSLYKIQKLNLLSYHEGQKGENQSLCRDWSSTGLFLFDNLQMFKSEISSEHDYLQGRYCEQDFILL